MLKNLLNRFLSNPPAPPAAPAAAPSVSPGVGTGALATTSQAAPASLSTPPDVARAEALVGQGNALEDQGQLTQAEACYREAVAVAPHQARGHLNLGIVLAARGDVEGASAAYENVLAIDPQHAFGNYNYARLLLLRGDRQRAEALIDTALRTKPDFAQALMVRSILLESQSLIEPAVVALKAALRLQPEDSGSWFNLGALLRQQGRPDEAEDAFRQALVGDPGNLLAMRALANAVREQGRPVEALALLDTLAESAELSLTERSLQLLLSLYDDNLSAEEILRRHVRFGADLEQAVPARFVHARTAPEPGRRLRIGYLSSDFVLHPVAFFLLPVIEHHDRTQVEVFCYSFARTKDKMNARLRELSDHWREVADLSDKAIADAVHADGIDLLIDLVGHTGEPRLSVFAQRPAPVQVSWLGYINTTGLSCIDYRLTDRRADPPDVAQSQHTERLHYLPNSQWCYQALVHEPVTPRAPFERQGHLTFGSFNAAPKISQTTCRHWGALLSRVPGSRLIVASCKSPRKRAFILREIEVAGVATDRVEFLERVPLDQYLALYNRTDIALDSFPYGGGTTTLDALFMGTPVAATVGPLSVSRSAASILGELGLDDWVAPSVDAWVDMVVAHANNGEALHTLRRELRARLWASSLTDVKRFARDLESAYREMWLEKTA